MELDYLLCQDSRHQTSSTRQQLAEWPPPPPALTAPRRRVWIWLRFSPTLLSHLKPLSYKRALCSSVPPPPPLPNLSMIRTLRQKGAEGVTLMLQNRTLLTDHHCACLLLSVREERAEEEVEVLAGGYGRGVPLPKRLLQLAGRTRKEVEIRQK